MSLEVPFLDYFSEVEDYRIVGMISYPLDEVLFVILVCTICGFEDFDDMVMWSEENLDWLRKFLPYLNGIPRPKTLRDILSHLDPNTFQRSFENWSSSMCKKLGGVVAIDGKTLRGSKENSDGSGSVHLVNAFAYNFGMVIGQEKVNDKSNEIKAIPSLLSRLCLEGTIVTIDAIATQKDIVREIRSKGADYLLSLKGNQRSLHEDVKLFLDDSDMFSMWDEAEQTDAGHGRVEFRHVIVTEDIDWLKERHTDWKDLRSIAKVESVRYNKKSKIETRDSRYYLSSLPAKAVDMLRYIRAHWSVENNLHWCLDVTFREDSCRIRKNYSAENMAIIRKSALNLLKRDDAKLSIKKRRTKALVDPLYRSKLIIC